MVDAQVIVVGGGPVGETLLALLGHRGVTAIGLEKELDVWPKPRAVHFDGETLRTLQSIGLGDAVFGQSEPMRNYKMVNEAGEVLLAFPTGYPGPEGWLSDIMFHQPDLDGILRSSLTNLDGITLLGGHEVTAITQTGETVTARTVDPDGNERDFTANYLVGADGAQSFVRHALGLKYDELGPNNPWLVVDGTFLEEPEIPDSMLFFGHYSRPRLWAALPGMRRRMEFKVLPTDDISQVGSPEWIARESDNVMRPDNFATERTAVYTFRSCLVDTWRQGRIFLAGDAAHLLPPLFGQGLCSGIRDAANLSWKLALVLDGADESILDTYESERKAHARAWVEAATRMSDTLQTTDEKVAAGRDQFLRDHPEAAVAPPPPLGPGFHSGGHLAGQRAVQPSVPDGRFDDRIGDRFLLAGRTELLGSIADDVFNALADDVVLILDENEPGVPELLEKSGAEAVLIRPDRYIYGVASSPEELSHLIEPVVALSKSIARTRAA